MHLLGSGLAVMILAIGATCAIVLTSGVLVRQKHLRAASQRISQIDRYRKSKKSDIEPFLAKEEFRRLRREALIRKRWFGGSEAPAFTVLVPNDDEAARLLPPAVFPLTGYGTYIFLPFELLNGRVSDMDEFILRHELQHSSDLVVSGEYNRFSSYLIPIVAGVFLLLSGNASIVVASCLGILALQSLHFLNENQQDYAVEAIVDFLALRQMTNEQRTKIGELLIRSYAKRSNSRNGWVERSTFSRRKVILENYLSALLDTKNEIEELIFISGCSWRLRFRFGFPFGWTMIIYAIFSGGIAISTAGFLILFFSTWVLWFWVGLSSSARERLAAKSLKI